MGAVQAREAARKVADLIEQLWRGGSRSELSADRMDDRYLWVEDTAYISTEDEGEAGSWICLATGGTPVDDGLRQELLRLETLRPIIRDLYRRLRYSDEVSYIDKRSLWATQINVPLADMNFLGGGPVAGIDIPVACRSGVTHFDYYGLVDADQNPSRAPGWMPGPFIDVIGQFIMSVHAPADRRTDDASMAGFGAAHYNLEWMNANTVERSSNQVLILSENGTFVGASPAAAEVLGLATAIPKSWASSEEAQNFIRVTRNLEQEKAADVMSLARGIRAGGRFDHSLSGSRFTVTTCEAPELNFYVAALSRTRTLITRRNTHDGKEDRDTIRKQIRHEGQRVERKGKQI